MPLWYNKKSPNISQKYKAACEIVKPSDQDRLSVSSKFRHRFLMLSKIEEACLNLVDGSSSNIDD